MYVVYFWQASLITVCANNILHKWSLLDNEGTSHLVHMRTYKFQGGLYVVVLK